MRHSLAAMRCQIWITFYLPASAGQDSALVSIMSCQQEPSKPTHCSKWRYWQATKRTLAVQEFKGRVNIMHSPIEYASFFGPDPLPDLDHIFFVSGLAPGTTLGDFSKLLDAANLGKARVNLRCRGTQVRLVTDTETGSIQTQSNL